MPIKRLDHVDLAVRDVERSLAFYLAILGPLGAEVALRFPTYRGTEEVVYLACGDQYLGFVRPTVASIATTRSAWSTSRSSWTRARRSTRPMRAASSSA